MPTERMNPTAIEQRRFRPSRFAPLLLPLALAACSSAEDRAEPVASARQVIAGGAADLAHQSVFMLIAQYEHSGGQCTATLIAPNLLLTARHCVSSDVDHESVLCGDSVLGEPYPPEAFFATNAARPNETSAFFRARAVRVPGQGEDTCGYDVALIILDENVPEYVSLPAVPRIDREVMPGEPYTAVGYGVNEDGNSTGTRMQLGGLSIACEPGSCGYGVESTEFRGETGICSGDSGGPALDGDGKVVGVVSRGGPGCSTPVYGTVTAWRDLLTDTAIEAAKLGGYDPPFWVTTGLSDPPELPENGEGGAAGAGGAVPVPMAMQGEACGSGEICAEGLVCYAPSSDSSHATCVASCTANTDCGDGEECRDLGDASICAVPEGTSLDESGCAVAAPRSSSGAWLIALIGSIALGARRRRQAQRPV
jgi:V8-like Glu-specific endopeptidase